MFLIQNLHVSRLRSEHVEISHSHRLVSLAVANTRWKKNGERLAIDEPHVEDSLVLFSV